MNQIRRFIVGDSHRTTAGCPVAYAMDRTPAQLIYGMRLGVDDPVLNSKTVWLCASCETCTTRRPQDIDVAKLMDAVKTEDQARRTEEFQALLEKHSI